ncbi:MAG: type IV toxin-antitoxin system AbiEi family antitoxin domain-containing protein [Nocardioides sp.]|nr:type IV toxin-antitoxin system AbiEi family antitoxin domain-containing protein [Nocardioides sp.]
MPDDLPTLLREQSGVVSRRQLTDLGLAPHDVRGLLRRGALALVHPGVYVDHTGPPTWQQRAWAGALHAWSSALCGPSALRAEHGPGRRDQDEEQIHVAVAHGRRVADVRGVRVHRLLHLDEQVRWNLGPPRQRVEDAALDTALAVASRSALDAIGVLTTSVAARSTTPARLREALDRRSRVPQRRWWSGVLDDLAAGTCSVLEHGHLALVERPHGLPRGRRQRQARASTGVVYRDVDYPGGLVVELDGRLFHDSARARDADMERDLDAGLDGVRTVRLSYGQVFDRPCLTAAKLAVLLRRAGWRDRPSTCGTGCPVAEASVG